MALVAVAVAVVIGAALQSAAGFGFSLVVAPSLFHALNPGQALTAMVVMALALSLLMLFGERRRPEIRTREVALVVGWAIPGLIAGVVVLGLLGKPILQVVVGVVVVLAAGADIVTFARAGAGPGPAPWTLLILLVAVGRRAGREIFVRMPPDRFRTAGLVWPWPRA